MRVLPAGEPADRERTRGGRHLIDRTRPCSAPARYRAAGRDYRGPVTLRTGLLASGHDRTNP